MPSPKKPKTLKERMEAIDKKVKKQARARAAKAKKAAKAPPATYRPAIVTFIDILGFKEMIQGGKEAHEIHAILAELRSWSGGDFEDDGDDGQLPAGLSRSIAFSDNVVRVCPIDGEEGGHGALFQELLSLVHVQAKLTERGVFLRGGVTVADIYMSGGEVFGPGLVRAYELESKLAIYPRIVVDPAVLETYFERPAMRGDHSIDEDLDYLGDLLRMGDDGLYFVDYLKACRDELNDPGAGYVEKLKEHAGYITKAASAFKSFSTTKQKYAWLAHYHNAVVDETEDADEDCKVDEIALTFPKLSATIETPEGKPEDVPAGATKKPAT